MVFDCSDLTDSLSERVFHFYDTLLYGFADSDKILYCLSNGPDNKLTAWAIGIRIRCLYGLGWDVSVREKFCEKLPIVV